jgi:hypothetical protein
MIKRQVLLVPIYLDVIVSIAFIMLGSEGGARIYVLSPYIVAIQG